MGSSAVGRRVWQSSPVRIVLAVVFAAATLLYSVLWMIAARPESEPGVELGFDSSFVEPERALAVTGVIRGSPAEAAGLLAGDRILAVDGVRLQDASSQPDAWKRHQAGDTVRLSVERRGRAVELTGRFRERAPAAPGSAFAREIRNAFPVPFVTVGLTVLFLRLEDPNAWLLALLFASFIPIYGIPREFAAVPVFLRPFAKTYQVVFVGLLGALFYTFFAVFPTRSPIERRLPWLKWAAVACGLVMALFGMPYAQLRLPPPWPGLWGSSISERIPLWYSLALLTLGLVSLAANFARSADPEARRKIRVIFWGTAAGMAPGLALAAADSVADFARPLWLSTATTALMFLFPLSFAYAVVKHRVLEIPVLLKRSARYLLVQRGFTFLLSLFSIGLTLLFALSFARYLRPAIEAAEPAGIALGAAFGTVLLWGGSQVHRRVSGRIDRAFFRSAYDARVILEDLAEKTRTATDRGELARLLEHHLEQALRPSFLAVHLEGDGAHAGAECVVPIQDRGGRQLGRLALGPRLSEEPYSGEDRRLLASVASQAAMALENIRLAAEIAERMEIERRAAREMEIAKEVQSRLLPEAPPRFRTLDCAARCIQARSVGGDCYDFLDLGPGSVGFVLADVSGKGVHAALLMANLQAHLRSQSAIAPRDPVKLLSEVNRMLFRSTTAQHYATLFFGIYDDATRRLNYVNCGHNAPVWLRADGSVERLESTATVIGAFERWECEVGEIVVAPGDLLVIFSDGVTEAARGEEEFGEGRLIEALRGHRRRPVEEIVTAVLARVEQFSAGAQSDDLTLLVAQGKPGTDGTFPAFPV